MPDSKITALTALTSADPANDMFPIVDVSDTSMAASGTTKRISINNLLAASGTATLASATITGDLTVATNKLKVTGGNVGIGTASPNNYANYTTLTINGTNGGEIDLTDGGTLRGQLFSESTGLTLAAVGGFIKFGAGTGGTEKMRLDSSGNVGIGVTPSAWFSTFKGIDLTAGSLVSQGQTNTFLTTNAFLDASVAWTYKTNNAALRYDQGAGGHAWYYAAANTGTITWTQAMTLDASGRLILLASTTTPATLATNGQLTFTATSNTNLRFSYRGSDGVTRTADLTLA